jgi:hypothetical protein
MHARQALYYLSHDPSPLSLVICSLGSCIYAGTGLDHDPPVYASQVAEMIGPPYPSLLLKIDLLGLPSKPMSLLISPF